MLATLRLPHEPSCFSPFVHVTGQKGAMSSDSTAVFIHESRYPLRVLTKLVPASKNTSSSDSGSKNYVRRLDQLFKYEPRIDLDRIENKSSSVSSSSKGKQREINSEEQKLSPREILTFESPVEGAVCEWCVDEGAILVDP